MDNANVKRRLTCILAADAVGYSKQMGQDEEGTIQVLSAHRSIIDGIITFHHGRIVSTAGDSVLAEFSSAVEAVRCAVEIQDALKTRNDALPEVRKMLFRVGVNLGDVVVKNDDLLGDGVNVAARLETMAEPGGICIASSVYEQITGKLDLGFQDIGEQNLKNISRPVRVYRVGGATAPLRQAVGTTPVVDRTQRSKWPLWIAGVAVAAGLAGLVAWQTSGTSVVSATNTTPETSMTVNPANTAQALAQAEAQRLRDEAQTLRLQAQAELDRAQAQVLAAQAAKLREAAPGLAQASAKTTSAVPPKPTSISPKTVTVVPNEAPKPTSPQPSPARFDGAWRMMISCQRPSGAPAEQSLDLVVNVRQGVLHGESGQPGEPGWRQIHGQIQPDGQAALVATIIPAETARRRRNAGVHSLEFPAKFQEGSGSGQVQQPRACTVKFSRA
jgi:class 3 adenylate cyclase